MNAPGGGGGGGYIDDRCFSFLCSHESERGGDRPLDANVYVTRAAVLKVTPGAATALLLTILSIAYNLALSTQPSAAQNERRRSSAVVL
jgi:hypothetical protein